MEVQNQILRRTLVWAAMGAALAVLVGAIVWASYFLGKQVSSSSGAACRPTSVTPSKSVTDIYDRWVLSLGPVMYLPLGHPSSGTEQDLSGNGHSGVYLPANDPPGLAHLPNGDPAALFDGVRQYVQVPSASVLSVSHTGCLSVQAWIAPATLQFEHEQGSGYVYLLGKGTNGQQEYALRMYSLLNTENPVRPNRISAYVYNLAGGLGSGSYFQDVVTPGAWILVTLVIDDKTTTKWPHGYVAIYKNASLRGRVSLDQFNVTPHASCARFASRPGTWTRFSAVLWPRWQSMTTSSLVLT